MKLTLKILYTTLLLMYGQLIFAQDTYTCANEGYAFLNGIIGNWSVQTIDRTSPGVYQNNSGNATITPGIPGCSICIRYEGTYRGKAYAREVSLIALDTIRYQMTAMDSEHGTYSFLEGMIENGKLVVYWFRNKDIGKLRSKYVMTLTRPNAFEFSSYLSTDFGESWALTHRRNYTRKE